MTKSIVKHIFSAGLLPLLFSVSVHAQDLTIPATDDTHIRGGARSGNVYGSSDLLEVRYNAYGDPSGEEFTREGLIKFDLSSINGTVDSAKLRLFATQGSGGPINIYLMDDDSWDQSSVTWDTAPTYEADPIATFTVPADTTGAFIEVDLTDAVAAQAAGDGTISLRIIADHSSEDSTKNFNRFESLENLDQAGIPVLLVNVTAGGSGGPDLSLPDIGDTHIRGGERADNNYDATDWNGWKVIEVRYNAYDPDLAGEAFTREGLIKFDVSSIDGSTVQSAKLRLYAIQASGGQENVFLMDDDSWDETTVTWNTAPPHADTPFTTLMTYDPGFVDIDVTNAVINEALGDGVMSLRLVNDFSSEDSSKGYNRYVSKEDAVEKYHPMLIVTTATQQLPDTMDTHIRGGDNADNNYDATDWNGWKVMEVRNNGYTDGIAFTREGLMKFDLSGIEGDVVSASVRLYAVQFSGGLQNVYLMDDDTWDETTVTWNTAPAYVAEGQDPHPVSSFVSTQQGYVTFDVTNAVRGQAAVDGTLSLRLIATDANSSFNRYVTKEDALTADHPVLLLNTASTGGGGSDTWRDYPMTTIGEDMFADTDGFLGVLYVNYDPWVYSYSLMKWIYLPDGPWAYVPRY